MTYSTNLTSTLDKGIFLLTINSNQNDENKDNTVVVLEVAVKNAPFVVITIRKKT